MKLNVVPNSKCNPKKKNPKNKTKMEVIWYNNITRKELVKRACLHLRYKSIQNNTKQFPIGGVVLWRRQKPLAEQDLLMHRLEYTRRQIVQSLSSLHTTLQPYQDKKKKNSAHTKMNGNNHSFHRNNTLCW